MLYYSVCFQMQIKRLQLKSFVIWVRTFSKTMLLHSEPFLTAVILSTALNSLGFCANSLFVLYPGILTRHSHRGSLCARHTRRSDSGKSRLLRIGTLTLDSWLSKEMMKLEMCSEMLGTIQNCQGLKLLIFFPEIIENRNSVLDDNS